MPRPSKPLYKLPDDWTWQRPAPRAPASDRPKAADSPASPANGELSPFYGYPAELIATWCRVSLKTATAWKKGKQQPSPAALALFELYADEQIVPEEFKGYRFAKGKLTPPGRIGFTPAQIEAYELIYKIATTYARPEVEAHLERMKLAMRESPPEAGTTHQPLPRWVWDPFFNPIEGARTVLDGTDTDRRD